MAELAVSWDVCSREELVLELVNCNLINADINIAMVNAGSLSYLRHYADCKRGDAD